MNYDEFEKAVETLGLISKTSRARLKQKYIELSKKYHPDMPEGDEQKFKEVNEAYKLLSEYMDNFRYMLNADEFSRQYPFSTATKNFLKGKM